MKILKNILSRLTWEYAIIIFLTFALGISIITSTEKEKAFQNYIHTSSKYINILEDKNEILEQLADLYSESKELNEKQVKNLLKFVKQTQDYQDLLKCVEAEAPDQGYEGKAHVASVILNRTYGDKFGNTIKDVIYAPGQFDVVEFGFIQRAKPTKETERAVDSIISWGPVTDALYFMNPDLSGEKSRGWFRSKLQHVITVGDHEFYK